MSALLLDGFDLAALGFVLESAPQWRDVPRHTRAVAPLAGRIGVLALGALATVEARTLELVGIQKAAGPAELVARLDELKRRLGRGELEIRLPDTPGRFFTGRLESLRVSEIRPAFSQRAHQVAIAIHCDDPRAYDVVESEIGFGAATEMPLGSAPVSPIVRIAAPNEPVVVLRDHLGAEQGRLELATTGVAWVEIDNARGRITGSDGADRSTDLVDGDFLTLDPAEGSPDGDAHPTLAVTGGAGTATYRRAWW